MLVKKLILVIVLLSTFASASDKSLYDQKCGICHGKKGEVPVMGKSKEIRGMTIEEIQKAMDDYASGERESIIMIKNLKKNFLNKYDSKTMYNIAKYIHEL